MFDHGRLGGEHDEHGNVESKAMAPLAPHHGTLGSRKLRSQLMLRCSMFQQFTRKFLPLEDNPTFKWTWTVGGSAGTH